MPANPTWRDIVESARADAPDQVAFTFLGSASEGDIACTYRELSDAARAIAAHLVAAGLAGERAVLLYPPGPDYVRALLGCLYAGVTAVPVYAPRPNASYARIEQVLASADAAVLLSSQRTLDTLATTEWGRPIAARARWLATDAIDAADAHAWTETPLDAGTLAVLQFTSGSTGTPKGVMLEHRHLVTNSRMIQRAMDCTPADVGVIWLPPYHDMGLIGGLLQPMYTRCPVWLMSPYTFLQRPLRWLDVMTRVGGSISSAPNFAYELCASRVRPDQLAALDLSAWRLAANGAEPVRADTLRRFADAFAPAGFRASAFFPCYGMAETTLYVSGATPGAGARVLAAERASLGQGQVRAAAPDAADALPLVSSGRPDPDTRVVIVDADSGAPLPAGAIGEILVQGETVAAGYWRRPADSATTFDARIDGEPGSWLRTGDLGALVDGELYVTGRIKEMIIVRGANHYPHDIEATLADLPDGQRPRGAAAFALDAGDGEGLGLVVELDRHQLAADPAPLAAAIRDAVAREHQLQIVRLAFVRPGGIPRTSSGKTQRRLARERLLAGELALASPPANDFELEGSLA
ncbi:fatty acyl-AMP ligase [Derxia lacustris]|uniref:fatty acyl-AMP ligase n=1 Tax=Derxia lacustris TaxID=764842 RepID=UPI000A172CB6|nr:fatty acyl-AMP ligase [Derxia lacustris]